MTTELFVVVGISTDALPIENCNPAPLCKSSIKTPFKTLTRQATTKKLALTTQKRTFVSLQNKKSTILSHDMLMTRYAKKQKNRGDGFDSDDDAPKKSNSKSSGKDSKGKKGKHDDEFVEYDIKQCHTGM